VSWALQFDMDWRGSNIPGDEVCTYTVFSTSGKRLAVGEFSFGSGQLRHLDYAQWDLRHDIDEKPAEAEISCRARKR
jgi:hypothetical protein